MSEKEIWLIRHGESVSNAGLLTTSSAESGLTEKGWRQARALAEFIDRVPASITTSSYLRARQTAQPLCERFPRVPLLQWPLHEFTCLRAEHYHHTTVAERRPLIESYWRRNDPDHCDGEGAESFHGFIERIVLLREYLSALRGFHLIVSHGHVIRCLLWFLLENITLPQQAEMRRYNHLRLGLRIPNAAVLTLTGAGGNLRISPFRLDHLPDTSR